MIDLVKEENIKMTEKLIKIDEFVEACKEKRVMDCFCSGTACVTHQVGSLSYKGVEYKIPVGTLSGELKNKLQNIQYGRTKHNWSKVVAKY